MAHVADVVIDNTQVDADLTDFVVYVDLSDLPADFWNTVANGGGDIRVFKSDGTTELAREVVSCDTATDTGELHIKFSGTLSSSSDTTIQIHADGTSSDYAVTATYGRNSTWSDYVAVWHMSDTTDSTGNGNTITVDGATQATGVLGGGYDLDGIDDKLLVSDSADVDLTVPHTMQIIARPDNASAANRFDMLYGKTFGNSDGYRLMLTDGGVFRARYPDLASPNTDSVEGWAAGDSLWLHSTASGSTSINTYFNGAAAGSSSTSGAIATNSQNLVIGATTGISSGHFDGVLDEGRMQKSALSSDWISTEYNNQSSPSTFYTASAVTSATTITGSGVVQNLMNQYSPQVASRLNGWLQ